MGEPFIPALGRGGCGSDLGPCRPPAGLREEAGLRQVEMAERLNRHQSFLSKYEGGQRRLDVIELRAVAGALGINLSELVRRFEETVERMKQHRRGRA